MIEAEEGEEDKEHRGGGREKEVMEEEGEMGVKGTVE